MVGLRAVTVTSVADTVVAKAGDAVMMRCGAKDIVLFQEHGINLQWLHDGNIFREFVNLDIRR